MIVTYENRIYRHEIEAIRKVMETLLPAVKAYAESSQSKGMDVTLVPQNRKVPLVAVTI